MYSLQIILNGANSIIQTTDYSVDISGGFISIPYENIIDIDYNKGGLMSKSTIKIVYNDNGNQNVLTMETKEKHNPCIRFINIVKENMSRSQNIGNNNPNNVVDQNNFNPINNSSQITFNSTNNVPTEQVLDSVTVSNGAIKGRLEIYENYLKIHYNNTFNIIYYNQMIAADKYKKTGNTYFVFVLLTDLDEAYEEHWLVQKILKGKKIDNILNHINNKIFQCKQNNDIQSIKVRAEPNSHNRIFFIGSIIEAKATLMGRTNQTYACICYLEQDYLTIEKLSAFTKRDRGDKKINYRKISSIDYDKPGTFGITSGIDLTISGSDVITIRSIFDNSTQNFYNMLTKVVDNIRKPEPAQIIQQEVQSNADELLKWHELYEKGVISEEEFNQKKNELL